VSEVIVPQTLRRAYGTDAVEDGAEAEELRWVR
jgi:hypothetical protein